MMATSDCDNIRQLPIADGVITGNDNQQVSTALSLCTTLCPIATHTAKIHEGNGRGKITGEDVP